MNRFSPPAAGLDDEALDRALSRARAPEVPNGLADRIVSVVTALPQDTAPGHGARVGLPREPKRRHTLAASLAIVVALGGGVLGLWLAGSAERPGARSAAPAIAEARSAAAGRSAPVAIAEREESRPPSTAGEATRGDGRTAAERSDPGLVEQEPLAPAALDASPEPEANPGDDTAVELAGDALPPTPAEHPSAPESPVGPSLADSAGHSSSTPDSAVYGPPAPQGMGIAGDIPSPVPTARPTGRARANLPGPRNRR